jgi:hypothetical protein
MIDIADIKELQQYLTDTANHATNMMEVYRQGSDEWSFYNGQIDGVVTARWKLQQLIEKASK